MKDVNEAYQPHDSPIFPGEEPSAPNAGPPRRGNPGPVERAEDEELTSCGLLEFIQTGMT